MNANEATHDLPLVVMATDSTAPSGVGEHMLTLARRLCLQHRVILAFPFEGDGARFLIRSRSSRLEAKEIGRDIASFSNWLTETAVSLLHVHAGIGWEGHGLAAAGRRSAIPVVRTEHLPYLLTDETQKSDHRLGIGMIDRLVCVSEAAAETFRQAGVSRELVVTIPNGIDRPEAVRPRAQTRRILGIPEGTFLVLTVARFTAQKGYAVLLAAASSIVRAFPDVSFVLVGNGPDQATMEALAETRGIARSVLFLGERHDVPDLLVAADLFVLPSFFEGLPLVILEAMALGLPVVATRIGGTAEALGADYPWLVDAGKPAPLAATIEHALRNSEERGSLGDHNRLRFGTRFGAERMGRLTAELYRTVFGERARNA